MKRISTILVNAIICIALVVEGNAPIPRGQRLGVRADRT